MLSVEVIERDRELEQSAERSTAKLAEHRWHWTLDESNDDRIEVSDYARQVARPYSAVRQMVLGFDSHRQSDDASTLQDHIGKARMSSETAAAAAAVAKARGISIRSAEDSRSPTHNEVRRVRDISRDLAEKHGTSIEEEAPKVAETIVRNEEAAATEQQERDARTDLRIIELEQHLRRAEKNLQDAQRLAQAIGWDDEKRDLIRTTWANVKALTQMIDALIIGADWDKEMEKMAHG